MAEQPAETFFRTEDVPGPTRGAARSFLSRAVHADPPSVRRVAPNLYWKAPPPYPDGVVYSPCWTQIGWAVAGPHAGAVGWYGANIVGWSSQIALQRVAFAVPGEPRCRRPHPRVTIRGRRNLVRRRLTTVEATHLEAVLAFDRWCEISWDEALESSDLCLRMQAERGVAPPRPDVFEAVAAEERPTSGGRVFRCRVASLVELLEEHDQR